MAQLCWLPRAIDALQPDSVYGPSAAHAAATAAPAYPGAQAAATAKPFA
jgi:hypothetical protein